MRSSECVSWMCGVPSDCSIDLILVVCCSGNAGGERTAGQGPSQETEEGEETGQAGSQTTING